MYWKSDTNLYPPYLRGRIRRGRGVGEGASYRPWLKNRDVPSKGTSSTSRGIIVQRPYHLLSELEAIYFYLIERRPMTLDIREQWPILHIDRTVELCLQLGVRHAKRGIYPEPFTVDFLITENKDGKLCYRAASIKTPEDAADPDVRLRLAVEHAWCCEEGIPWTLIDTSSFDKTMLSALRFMRGWKSDRYRPEKNRTIRFKEQFYDFYGPNIVDLR